jgi:homoserine dehydrogenase
MFEEGLDFKQALILAQQAGFAESNPTLDIEGYDTVNKWAFLLTHAYGIMESPEAILFNGIQNIHGTDAVDAKAKKLKNGKVAAFVLPQFVNHDDHLAFVKNEYNGVVIESGFADKQFFYVKGAGSLPTASAVLSDISALRYQYRYEYKKLYHHVPHQLCNDIFLRVYLSYDEPAFIPKERFEWIDEWQAEENRKYLFGVISFAELKENTWWKENSTSLILLPEPIIEETATRQLKKRSLESAGIF